MKKNNTLHLLLILALIFTLTFAAAEAAFGATSTKGIDAAPFLENDRIYDSVRPIAETFGIYVSWDQAGQTVTLARGPRRVVMAVGSYEESVTTEDGQKTISMDVAPVLRDGRVYLPVRLWAEHFGLSVEWRDGDGCAVVSEGGKALTVVPGVKELTLSEGHFLKAYESDHSMRFFYPEGGVPGVTWEGYAEILYVIDGVEIVIAAVHAGAGRSDPVRQNFDDMSAQIYQNAEINNTNVLLLPDACYGAPAFRVDGVVSGVPQAGVVFLLDDHICGLTVEVKRPRLRAEGSDDYDMENVLEMLFDEPGEAEAKLNEGPPVQVDEAQLVAELAMVNALLDEIMASFVVY